MRFGYMCTVTLNLKIWTFVKVMTHLWVMGNNCVKYSNPTLKLRVMAKQILAMCVTLTLKI